MTDEQYLLCEREERIDKVHIYPFTIVFRDEAGNVLWSRRAQLDMSNTVTESARARVV